MSDEDVDLYNSYNDDNSSQKSLPSFSDCSINANGKIPELQNEWKTKFCPNSASFNRSSDDEESFSLEPSPQNCSAKSSQNLTILTHGEEIFDSPQQFSFLNSNSFDEFSFEQRGLLSDEKITEYKVVLSKVNEQCLNWRINEFMLETIKTKSTSWARQIKAITKTSEIQSNILLRNENCEITNLLGLEEDEIKLSTNRSLALFSKSAFFDHAVELVRANVAKLKLQKKSLQDEFGVHSMKTVVGIMSREKKEQLELYRLLDNQQNRVRQMLSSSCIVAQQLATLWHNSDRHLQAATLALLRNKALYLHTVISSVREKLDQSLFVDENMKKKMDTEGDNLKTQVTQMSEELKVLQKTLTEYEKKESESDKYKEIVAECGKLKKQLQHKYQTLSMLNDPNMSF